MSAMIPILPERDRRRLISTCGLLASDRDREVIAAVRAAARLLQPHGRTVAELVEIAIGSTPTPWAQSTRPDPVGARDHQHLARMYLITSVHLKKWERDFLTSLTRWDGPLSPKQRAALETIEIRINRLRR
ncbi:MAG TPA: hypothetical protein VNI79_07895 [Sphingomicrobium sp.]|nr:hypothetical protein [Sphingomicrobium sp.]